VALCSPTTKTSGFGFAGSPFCEIAAVDEAAIRNKGAHLDAEFTMLHLRCK
jgi:hypothetical protein